MQRLHRLPMPSSRRVDVRPVDVWLPPGYDGQMLFDAATTWNKQAWDVDAIAARLLADACLGFLAEQLKPAIDANYAARPGRDDTLLMGSSMGGLISIYALLAYPQVFGAAAALSTNWITMFEDNAVFKERGFGPPNAVSRVLEGTGHNERAWSARLETPLSFLLAR